MRSVRHLALVLVSGALLLPVAAMALKPPPKGLTASPAIINLKANPGQNSLNFSITLTNNTSQNLTINVATNDFTALGQNGAVSFYSGNYSSKANPHGLAYWMHPAIKQLPLIPGASKVVPVTIANISAMARGGHYGGVIFTVAAPPGKGGSASVSNNQVVSTLVFMTTAGQGDQTLKLATPLLSSTYFFNLPSFLPLVLSDAGNTQTVAHGYASLQSPGGQVVSKGLLDVGSGLILPGSSRLFGINLNGAKPGWFGGRYTLNVAYRPDNSQKFTVYHKKLLVVGIGWPIVLAVVLIMALIWRLLRRRHYPQKQN